MTDAAPYKVPKEPGRWRAIALAAVVHAALFGLLWFGVRWQSETPVAVEAEVWSPQAREAAPRPQPAPEPEPKPEPKPVARETPKPKVIEPPAAKPDIALEQEKKRKQQQEKQRREEQERREKELETQKQLAEQKRKQQEVADAAKKKLAADAAKKAADDKKRKQQDAAEAAVDETRRQADLDRLRAQAGTGGAGQAPKSQGGGRADAAYADRVGAKIKSNINFNVPDNLTENSAVEYLVELLPDGSVKGLRKTKSSGLSGFDEAVRRAIERSQPYPKDNSGSVPSSFIGIHRPKD